MYCGQSELSVALLITKGCSALDGMFWLPWIILDRRIRAVIAERLTRGASDDIDHRLAALILQRDSVARAGWFS
jgi:hypothetical protein